MATKVQHPMEVGISERLVGIHQTAGCNSPEYSDPHMQYLNDSRYHPKFVSIVVSNCPKKAAHPSREILCTSDKRTILHMSNIESALRISLWHKCKFNKCHSICLHPKPALDIYFSSPQFLRPKKYPIWWVLWSEFRAQCCRSWRWPGTVICTEVKKARTYPISLHIVGRKTSLLHDAAETD